MEFTWVSNNKFCWVENEQKNQNTMFLEGKVESYND